MFLNENVKNVLSNEALHESIDVEAVIAEHAGYTHEMGVVGALMMNLAESEAYHNTVESMIVAEHTSIVNEDANLLNEAKGGFVAKIKNIWSAIVKWIVGMWNKVVAFFKDLCTSNKKLAEKIAKAKTLKDVTLEAGYAFDPENITKVGDSVIKDGTSVIASIMVATTMPNITKDAMNDGLKNSTVKENEEVINWLKKYVGNNVDDRNKVVTVLKEKFVGKPGKMTYNAAIIKKMGVFVGDHNTAIKTLQAAFKDLIACYKKAEGYFAKLGKELEKGEGNKLAASRAQKISANCRKVSSLLNTVIGVATDCNKLQYRLAKSVCMQALGGKADKEDVKSESANILDTFAI